MRPRFRQLPIVFTCLLTAPAVQAQSAQATAVPAACDTTAIAGGTGVVERDAGLATADTVLVALADSLIAAAVGPGEPGVAVVVRRDGREIVARARGRASMEESGELLNVDTPMYVASVAKPVTAAAVALLLDRGVLSRATPVDSLFPELPQTAGATVGHLLDHTSGIPDYFRWIEWPKLRHLANGDVVDSLAAHPKLDFPPGDSAAYSNSGYVLLAEAVRRASERSLAEVLRLDVAGPLGLGSWSIDDGDQAPPAGAAHGYYPEDGAFRLSDYEQLDLPGGGPRVRLSFSTTGAGGLYSSARDLARWSELVAAGRVPGLPDGASANVPSLTGGGGSLPTGSYRGGWYVGTLEGELAYWHEGNRAGFRAAVLIVPMRRVSAAAVANRSDLDVGSLVATLVREILAGTPR